MKYCATCGMPLIKKEDFATCESLKGEMTTDEEFSAAMSKLG